MIAMGASRAETGPLRPPPLWTMRQCSAAVCAARSAACPPLEASALASCVVRDSKKIPVHYYFALPWACHSRVGHHQGP